MPHVDEALGTGAERKVAGLRWLRAAAEIGRSEAAGWPEVPPPVGTRKKLTLTSGRFRAQIVGFNADPRCPDDYNARGRRSWRLLRAECPLADALRGARGMGGWLFLLHLLVQLSARLHSTLTH